MKRGDPVKIIGGNNYGTGVIGDILKCERTGDEVALVNWKRIGEPGVFSQFVDVVVLEVQTKDKNEK